jgi:SP family general alpha glucoside:H+ symporter-like MFS transporter
MEDAKNSLRRLVIDSHLSEEELDAQIALMRHTDELEKAEIKGATFGDCFRKSNLRRTEIVSRCHWFSNLQ